MNPIWKHAPSKDDGWHTELEWTHCSNYKGLGLSWYAYHNGVRINIDEAEGEYGTRHYKGHIGTKMSNVYCGQKHHLTFAAAEAALIAAIDEIRLAK